ncbi:MAG TPA: hypothetical protein RMH99_04960, partial [Sandaracinaceae bacterium LLY-WYZ-13_1]|nr:hypothetical protein [Sandaracinaceae bacterium LLY-WYZ-13_1]
MPRLSVAIVALVLGGCLPRARHHTNHPLPMTAQRLASINSGDAVVSYLRQRDADPRVCVPDSTAPHVVLPNPRDLEDLVDGVGRGARLDKWEACVRGLLGVLPPDLASVVVARILERYAERILYPGLEGDGVLLAQIDTLRRLYDERPPGRDPTEEAVATLVARLEDREAEASHTGRQYRDALLSVLYLERGLTPDGRPVSVEALDALARDGDEGALLVYSRRIPDPRLRQEARRRLVQVRIRTSPFDSVRANAAEVLARVLRDGRNAVPLPSPPSSATVDPNAFPFRGLVVTQDVGAQRARLLSYVDDERNTSVVPPIELRGVVRFDVEGYARPLTLCASPEELDPTPCVAASEIGLGVPIATVEGDGRFRFLETISTAQVLELVARGEDELVLPILFRGEPLTEARWPMRFHVSGPLLFQPGHGMPGTSVQVEVDGTGANVIATVRARSRRYRAVLEPSRLRELRVVAAGGDGRPGEPGRDGAPGQDGRNGRDASCPNTPGTDGTPG